MNTSVLDEALVMLHQGMSPIPILPGGSKMPPFSWKRYQSTQATESQVRQWFTEHPDWGLGVICGAISGNLTLIEIEGRAASELPALGELAQNSGIGDLWARAVQGWSETSPSGGWHLYVRTHTPADRNQKLARRPTTEAEQAEHPGQRVTVLAETRGEGGLSVTAPTPGTCHATGKPWVRVLGGPTTTPTLTGEEMAALLDVFRTLDEMPTPASSQVDQGSMDETPRSLPATPRSGLSPNDDFEARTTWEDILTPHGWTIHHTEGRTTYWTRPGKPTMDGPSATTGKDPERDRLYVFTTSTEFEAEVPYTKPGAFAVLNHNGDNHAAARELYREGYGERADRGIVIDLPTHTTPQPSTPTDGNLAEVVDIDTHRQPGTLRDCTEDANALLLIDTLGHRTRYIADRARWLHWDGHTWTTQPAGGGQVKELAKQVLRALPDDNEQVAKWRKRSLSSSGVNNTLTLASTDPRIVITQDQLDNHPDQLNTPTGIVDLTTGLLGPSDPTQLHTRSTLVAPDPDCPTPRWDQFLQETFRGHPGMPDYLQLLAGYAATGRVTAQVLPFLHGAGANGKTVLAEVLQRLLADYSEPAPSNFLMQTSIQHPTEIARLQGARLVIASEVSEDARFDEVKVKQLTGGDSLAARYMHGDFFTFTPTHKLWLLGNHQPKVSAGGYSFWRRLRLIPFTNVVPEERRIGNLADQLVEQEGPGILHWVVQGAAKFIATGLTEPDEVVEATKAYEEGEDHVKRFVDDRLIIGGGDLVRTAYGEMRGAYTSWCKQEGIQPLTQHSFSIELAARFDVTSIKSDGVRKYTNVTIANPEPEDDEQPAEPDGWGDLGGGRW